MLGTNTSSLDDGHVEDAAPFRAWQMRGVTFKNKIFKAATHDGTGFDEMRRCYVRLARNDVSLVTVAYMAVSRTNKTFDTQHHIGEDNLGDWTDLCAAVHTAGGKMSAQLHHPGLFVMSQLGRPMGPSFFWLPSKFAWPVSLDQSALDGVRREFEAAAGLCLRAGFDCIELHCGHGYLLSQFLTPLINRRRDKYGGTTQGRAKFPIEVILGVRKAVGEMPVMVKMNADDGFAGGLRLGEAVEVAKLFADAGADAIIPSFGYTSLNGFGMLRGNVPLAQMAEALPGRGTRALATYFGSFLVPQVEYESLFLREHSNRFSEALNGHGGTCVIYVGGADSLDAVEAVLGDGCAAVQLGRPLIREPFFVRKMIRASRMRARSGFVLPRDDGDDDCDGKSKCIRCNLCTLTSIDPVRFKAGCPFLRPGEGEDLEDLGCSPSRL